MKFVVEKNWINVLGRIWMPYGLLSTMTIDLDDRKIRQIGEPTRENVENWLNINAGDFSSIIDFQAVIGEVEINWDKEENMGKFIEITFPQEVANEIQN